MNTLLRSPIADGGTDTVIAAGGDAATVTCSGGGAKFEGPTPGEGAAIIVRGGDACARYI